MQAVTVFSYRSGPVLTYAAKVSAGKRPLEIGMDCGKSEYVRCLFFVVVLRYRAHGMPGVSSCRNAVSSVGRMKVTRVVQPDELFIFHCLCSMDDTKGTVTLLVLRFAENLTTACFFSTGYSFKYGISWQAE